MKKIILFVILVGLLVLGFYYFQFQTYFIDNRVDEEMPEMEEGLEPVVLKEGNFGDSDFIHKGTGKAKVIEYPDGSRILRFEDFEVTNGPDLFVYLSDSENPKENLGSYVDLGVLKGNIGNQNYELPENLEDFKSVVIWCKEFGVLFPYAVLN